MNEVQNVFEARRLINELIPLVEDAEKNFKSARNWGFIDVFGGGFLTDVIKHVKLNSASSRMNEITCKMQELQRVLNDISIPSDYRMQMGGFSIFADFIFDGAIADIYMQSKIMSSLEEVKKLKNNLHKVRDMLCRM